MKYLLAACICLLVGCSNNSKTLRERKEDSVRRFINTIDSIMYAYKATLIDSLLIIDSLRLGDVYLNYSPIGVGYRNTTKRSIVDTTSFNIDSGFGGIYPDSIWTRDKFEDFDTECDSITIGIGHVDTIYMGNVELPIRFNIHKKSNHD